MVSVETDLKRGKMKNKKRALMMAKTMSLSGCKHVVREYYGEYFVCPLNDIGYSCYGLLVAESL